VTERIIDSHLHLSERPDDALNKFAQQNGLRYTLDELLSTMRRLRVEHGLLLSPPLKNGSILPNQEVMRICKKSRGILKPIITAEPSANWVKAAINLADENRREVRGFKVRLGYVKSSAESQVFGPLYDYAEEKKVPVLFHTGDTAFSNGSLALAHPLTLDGLANKREELRIVLCHFGNPWFEDVAELVYKHPSVYADISGLITSGTYAEEYAQFLTRKISEAIYFAQGAEKVLFGTDYPVSKHSDVLSLVKSLKVDEADRERILSRNAEKLFNF
jgi:uncharacterized protein